MRPLPVVPTRSLTGAFILTALVMTAGLGRSLAEPENAGTDAKVMELIRQLGDSRFEVREAASKELARHGEAARKHLEDAVRNTTDAEVRARARRLLEVIDRERRLATGMHVIGLYEAGSGQHFRLITPGGRDTDWPRLCAALVEQGKKAGASPAKRFWELLPKVARDVAADRELVGRIDSWVKGMGRDGRLDREAMRAMNRLGGGLQQVMERPNLYEAKAFAGVELDDEAKQLLARQKKLSVLESWVLNRRLFEASFPGLVKKNPFRLDKATVPVHVAPTKEPIIMVLCSYESVRWQIQADKAARIKKVIVGGSNLQDVIGTDAPVSYRVYEAPQRAKEEPRFFYPAYKKDDEDYRKLADVLRKLTGKEINTFQGRYRYEGGAPFVVGIKE